MKSILNIFKKKEIQIDEKSKNNEDDKNIIRTQKEINKLLYLLDDELHNLHISEEKKMKLMKN